MFRLMNHRFQYSPNAGTTSSALKVLFTSYGYDIGFTSTDYSTGSYGALGNYLAEQIIAFGLQDNSNEQNDYYHKYYTPVNDPLVLELYEDNGDIDPMSDTDYFKSNYYKPIERKDNDSSDVYTLLNLLVNKIKVLEEKIDVLVSKSEDSPQKNCRDPVETTPRSRLLR